MEQDEAKAIELMERIGGGFASALAVAWQRADLNNQHRLKAAFPDLLKQYVEHVRLIAEREA